MFRMPAFVDDFKVCLMAAYNADQRVCLVLLSEVSTETTLSVLNCFHVLIILHGAVVALLIGLLESM